MKHPVRAPALVRSDEHQISVLATGEPQWLADAPEDANFPRAEAARQAGLHAAAGFPLRSPAGVVVAHPFRLDVTEGLRNGRNEIAVEVTNLSANRIRDLDRRGVAWRKFYDVNLVDQNYKPFDASGWDPEPSGLLGPVRLIPLKQVKKAAQAKGSAD